MVKKTLKRFFVFFLFQVHFALLSSALSFQEKESIPSSLNSSPEKVHIYIDADFSNHFESSRSIERGIKVALSRVNFKIHGREIKIIRKDHKANPVRSKRHILQYLKDPHALLIYSGMHSPPLLINRDFINKNRVLFLDPWAAAGSITRYPSSENWIFRLSIDDTKAGVVLSHFAVREKSYKRPFLILEDTGWGQSNYKILVQSLNRLGVRNIQFSWFNWNLRDAGAKALIRKVLKANSDVIFLVSNDFEGATIVRALLKLSPHKKIPILSHWGILGGHFHEQVCERCFSKLNLMFLQTRFSFIGRDLDKFERSVWDQTKIMFSDIKSPKDIVAPTGFIHAYDLTILLIEALKSISLTGQIEKDRLELRKALEQIKGPVRGLIKSYRFPFSRYSKHNNDAHEALRIEDIVMAKFGRHNEILLHPWRFKGQ